MPKLNFTTAKSHKRLALIMQRLALGDATTTDLIQVAGCNRCTSGEYLRHLVAAGKIVCLSESAPGWHTSTPAVWSLAEGVALPAMPAGCTVAIEVYAKGDVRKVTIRKEWTADKWPKQSIFAALGL
jgi:hypothetical protein